MSNIAILSNVLNQAPYLADGVAPAILALLHNIPPGQKAADDLALYTSDALTTTAVAVNAAAGKLHAVVIQSKGALGYLSLWNVAQGSVTVGTTSQDMAIPFTATSGHTTAVYFGGTGNGTAPLWATALTAAIATTARGNSAVGTLPVVWIIYS